MIKITKQRHIPGVGALIDSLFSCLPFLSFINFIFISIVVYADIHPYLKVHMPWVQMWSFMAFLSVVTILMMLAVYKFVLPSLWAFRGKQMFGYESRVIDEIQKLQKEVRELKEEKK